MATIARLRNELEHLDKQLLQLLAARMHLSRCIAPLKQQAGMETLQPEVWQEQLNARLAEAEHYQLDKEFIRDLFNLIHKQSVITQLNELARLHEKVD